MQTYQRIVLTVVIAAVVVYAMFQSDDVRKALGVGAKPK